MSEMYYEKIKTFKQYVAGKHEKAAERHGISVAEARRELPEEMFWSEWRDYVVDMFDSGVTMTTRMWRTLDEGLQYRVLRTRRALRDDMLTRSLVNKIHD